jgi:hypothetical protein
MWASLETGIPTLNGYSGFNPPGYESAGLEHPEKVTPENLDAWRHANGLMQQKNCLIRY